MSVCLLNCYRTELTWGCAPVLSGWWAEYRQGVPCSYFQTTFSIAVNEVELKSSRCERNFLSRCNLWHLPGFLLERDFYLYRKRSHKKRMSNRSSRIIAGEWIQFNSVSPLRLSLFACVRNKLNSSSNIPSSWFCRRLWVKMAPVEKITDRIIICTLLSFLL